MKIARVCIFIFWVFLFVGISRGEDLAPSGEYTESGGLIYEAGSEEPFSGVLERYYSNGQKKIEITYREGRKSGVARFWYEDGTLKMRGGFLANRADGIWEKWYPSGQMMSRGVCKVGKKIGRWTTWFESGSLKVIEKYSAGEDYVVAELQDPFESGSLKVIEEDCVDGNLGVIEGSETSKERIPDKDQEGIGKLRKEELKKTSHNAIYSEFFYASGAALVAVETGVELDDDEGIISGRIGLLVAAYEGGSLDDKDADSGDLTGGFGFSLSGRMNVPWFISPFVGVGLSIAGLPFENEEDNNRWNNHRWQYKEKVEDWDLVLCVYPEAGITFRLFDGFRISAGVKYVVATLNRDRERLAYSLAFGIGGCEEGIF